MRVVLVRSARIRRRGSQMSNKGRLMVAALVMGVSSVAIAAASPLLFSATLDEYGSLSLVTNKLPKGWFSSKNVLDRKKSNLVLGYTLGATSCSAASTLPANSSVFDGS